MAGEMVTSETAPLAVNAGVGGFWVRVKRENSRSEGFCGIGP